MKLESPTSRRLAALLRAKLPHGVTFKHNDMSTKGIPDLSVTHAGRTIWVEAKYVDELSRISDRCVKIFPARDVDGIQWEHLRKMGGNGYLAVYTPLGVALTRVSGYRESVASLRLALEPLETVAGRIVAIVKRREE